MARSKPKVEGAPAAEVLSPRETALKAFNETEAGLAALRDEFAGKQYDVTTTKGMQEAKEDRAALRGLRVKLEGRRKDEKAYFLEAGRAIDGEANRIKAEIEALEDPIDAQIKVEEDRKEREKQARIDAERARVEGIQERIREITGVLRAVACASSTLIADHIGDIEAIVVDDSFAEFQDTARAEKHETIGKLRELMAAAKKREDDAAQMQRDREELDRRMAEQAERDRVAQQQRDEDDRKAQAERDRLAAEAKAKADEDARVIRERAQAEAAEQAKRDEAARAELAAQREANRLESERLAKERAEREASERKLEAQRLAAERAREIESATLHGAATDAVALLRELGQAEHITTLKLEAALSRDVALARAA